MLKSLYVKNFALIEETTIEFGNGLNIITGETGAGKSILIGALGLILGGRASADVIRQGSRKTVVEGIFSVNDSENAQELLRCHDYETGDEIILRREITSKGGSRAFINDSPAPLTLVRELGDQLVDLHGQHDHQLLLRPETHIHLLDNAGGLEQIVRDFAAAYRDLHETYETLADLRRRESQLREKKEFYEFQLREIDEVDPQPDEDIILQQDLKVLENYERVYELTSSLHSLLYDDENSIRDQLLRARNLLDRLANIDPGFADYRTECTSATVVVEEIAKFLQSYSARVDFSPEILEEKRERLLKLSGLRKKFGGTLQEVLEYRDGMRHEVELVENFDERIGSLQQELEDKRREVGLAAHRLSRKRREVAGRVEKSVQNVLKSLGIEKGRFQVRIEQNECDEKASEAVAYDGAYYRAGPTGFDQVEFYISANLGVELKPLARIASGGEISRVMLALKTILAKNDKLPLLVFDEIDTGISGRIASKVGAALKNLADFHQIIVITHLPQIAAMSNTHFIAEKSAVGGRTVTGVRLLDFDEHIREVAKLISGETVTESGLEMARELIES